MDCSLRLLTLAAALATSTFAAGCKPAARVITRGVVIKNIRDQQREKQRPIVPRTRHVPVEQRWRAAQGR